MTKNRLVGLADILKSAGLEDEAQRVTDLVPTDSESELFVVDFDGTLFRSPMEPPFSKGGWWSNPRSLSVECIGDGVDDSWWIPETLSASRAAISNPNIFSMLLTGRVDRLFRDRVPYLLHDKGLNFDRVALSNTSDTKSFKSLEILKALSEYPSISKVQIWDDKHDLLSHYVAMIKRHYPNIEVTPHHISALSRPALCDNEPPLLPDKFPAKNRFVGIMLDSESKGKLVMAYPAKLDKEHSDHVTVAFAPTEEKLESMRDILGKTYTIRVTGYVEDEAAQVVTVDVPGIEFDPGKIPHITIATAEGVQPKYSNELLAKVMTEPVGDLTLTGILWFK